MFAVARTTDGDCFVMRTSWLLRPGLVLYPQGSKKNLYEALQTGNLPANNLMQRSCSIISKHSNSILPESISDSLVGAIAEVEEIKDTDKRKLKEGKESNSTKRPKRDR